MSDILTGFIIICVIGLGFWIILPKEQTGTISYTALNSCTSKIEVEPYSPSTYFKTFTCVDGSYSSGKDCYYMETENGVCKKSIHYFKSLSPTNNTNTSEEPISWESLESSSNCTDVANSYYDAATKNCICNNGYEIDWSTMDCAPKNQNAKCVVEDSDTTICDLSYSSSYYSEQYRDTELEGNSAACVDVITGESHEVSADNIRASSNASFCATDFGRVYIDPNVEVSKFYGAIRRDSYSSPYKINSSYDTCIWTYNDGNANIPYLEVLGNIGPRSGYNVKAFCRNGRTLDIYSYND